MNLASLFPRNEHIADRALRVILGIALIAIVFVGPQTPLGWLGIVPLFTGLVGSCPLYTITGFCTLPKNEKG